MSNFISGLCALLVLLVTFVDLTHTSFQTGNSPTIYKGSSCCEFTDRPEHTLAVLSTTSALCNSTCIHPVQESENPSLEEVSARLKDMPKALKKTREIKTVELCRANMKYVLSFILE